MHPCTLRFHPNVVCMIMLCTVVFLPYDLLIYCFTCSFFCKLDADFIVVITGPNAGGKTVVLKTIGLLSLLLQSGIHIPVSSDSNFHFFDNILVDIGDEQSIEDDLSTFSSHLTNIKSILEQAGKNSIVLLDEIGTGTDPSEGSALASAILTELRDKKALVFASTHHGNLKLTANDEKGFVNAAMEFDHKNLVPTYKFKLGVPGSSYAFEIARRIGIEDSLLNEALNVMDTDKHKIEQFLVDLESKSNELQAKLKELEIENSRLAGLSNLYKNNIEKLENEKKEILKKTKADVLVTACPKCQIHFSCALQNDEQEGHEKLIIKDLTQIIAEHLH